MSETEDFARDALATAGTRRDITSRALRDAARRLRRTTGRAAWQNETVPGRDVDRVCRIGGFILLVVLPTIAAGLYFGFIAADQYVTEMRFVVRGGFAPMPDGIASLTGLPSAEIVQNTLVVLDYVESRALVERLDATIGLRDLFAKADVDWLSRLDVAMPVDKIVRYWRGMIDATVEMPSGIVVMRLRAFSPQDAVRIAEAVLAASEDLVNAMNARMLLDTRTASRREQMRAAEQLAAARAALEQGRNKERSLDAHASAEAVSALIADVRSDLLRLRQDYDVQTRYLDEATPQMRNRRTRIAAAERQIDDLRSTLTASTDGGRVLSASMNVLDGLVAQRQLAETHYAKATSAAELAEALGERQIIYLNAFVRPTLPQSARFPLRLLDTCLVLIAGLALYAAARVLIMFRH